MDCPVCKSAMVTFELDKVEIDHCYACCGIWLDAGELELLLGDSKQSKELLSSFHINNKSVEKPRKCPICRKKMQKVFVGPKTSNLLIDKCRRGHGLWFDKGELQDILQMGNFDKDRKIQKLLSGIFSQTKPNINS